MPVATIFGVWLLLFLTANLYNAQRMIKSGVYSKRVVGMVDGKAIIGRVVYLFADTHQVLILTSAGRYLSMAAESVLPIDIL